MYVCVNDLFYRCTNDENKRLTALWTVLHKLPQANYDNLRYFIKFLHILTQKQEFNKMSPQNLAIVIAPNLIWNPNINNSNIGLVFSHYNFLIYCFDYIFTKPMKFSCYSFSENMNLANQYSSIVEYLVKYADWFFPEGNCSVEILVDYFFFFLVF